MEEGLTNYLTTREACKISGYSESGLRKLRRLGKIRGKVVGKTALYWREDIERLALEGRGRTPPS